MAQPQLRLVADPAPGFNAAPADSVRVVFEHWAYMLNKPIRRTKLGPPRRAAINAALAMGYDVETLLLTIEGMAADPMDWARSEESRTAMRELDRVLATEARIEHWAELGEKLRAEAERQQAAPAAPRPVQQIDHAAEAAARERLRQRAAELRAQRHG